MEKEKTLDNTSVKLQPEPPSVLALNVLASGLSTPLLDPPGGLNRISGINQFLAGTLPHPSDVQQLTLSPGWCCVPAYLLPTPPPVSAHQLTLSFQSK